MPVWQAYGVGEGIKIKDFKSKQDISGLKRVGEWSQEVTRTKQKTGKEKSKACESDLKSAYSCLEPTCILTFSTLEQADEHMDTGHHIMLPEKECVYDIIRRQWAATTNSIKGKSQKIGDSLYTSEAALVEEASQGWALKKQKSAVRISPAVKEYLTRVFNEGTKDGNPKANPVDVAEDLKRKFVRPNWLEAQSIKGYFSRLAALQKGQEVSEEDTSCEDVAIAREQFLQNLITETQKQIDLQHPLTYDNINLCELFGANKLDQALKKLKISSLKSMCDFFGVDICGPTTRKASFINAIYDLLRSCQCQVTTHEIINNIKIIYSTPCVCQCSRGIN